MKKILLIASGGTIASKRTSGGLVPLIHSDELLAFVPWVKEFCSVDAVQILNLDSTNICPEHWILMVETIAQHYERYDGFVICHGTDTMSYTSAALSYLLQHSKKPVVITGSQKPIDLEMTDAKTNLSDSLLYASDPKAWGVSIVFGGKVIAGTRARKMRTKSYNAISSINFPDIAVIQDKRIVRYMKDECSKGKPEIYTKLNDRVFLLKLIPGMDSSILDYLMDCYDGLIIESYGVGGIPDYENADYYRRLERWVERGKTVVVTTQVLHEGSDMEIYRVGHKVKRDLGILEAYDMTLESVITKLMWILGQGYEQSEIPGKFYTEVNYDILFAQ